MKRTMKLLAVTVALTATITGVAGAASSPTVATRGAINVGNTTAKLQATINPNGNQTSYTFQYGVTNAYGQVTKSHSVGKGTKTVSVSVAVGGLTPGTVYHYRVDASNKSGTAVGSDRKFTTTGHPPAGVVTGPAVNVRKTSATVTGSVNPNGQSTTWVVQYGLTAAYGVQTFGQGLANVNAPLPVSAQLSGLSPATLFHYRVVAYHGSSVVSSGADETFFTEPQVRPRPRLTARTTPSRDRSRPYVFTTAGSLHGAGSIPAPLRCAGKVGLRYYQGSHRVGLIAVPVGPNCRFTARASFKHLSGHGPRPLSITIDFRGNGYVAPASRTNYVTAG